MSKPIVLVIHGMGTHLPGEMKSQVIGGLNEAAKNFGLEKFNIEDKVEFFQFNYSAFLDELRKKDADHATSMSEHLTFLQGYGLGESLVTKLTGFFANFGEDKMLYTHWMDVVYYGLTFWGEKIRVDCAKRLNDIMIESNSSNREVHIVAHSLGVAVLHDTLSKIFRKDVDLTANVPGLDVGKFKIKSVWAVANVSRLLYVMNDIADPYKSTIRAGGQGCCDLMVNVRNEFDPFTWVKQYNHPIGTASQLVEVNTVRIINTHDIREYMSTPRVAGNFFSYLLGIDCDSNFDQAVEKYNETSINVSVQNLKEAFSDIPKADDISDKLEALEKFFSVAQEFNKRMKSLVGGNENV